MPPSGEDRSALDLRNLGRVDELPPSGEDFVLTLFCVIIIISQVLHKGMYRSVAWQTFLASFVRWRLSLRFGLACISAGTSLLFIGHFPTLKPTGQMFAPMTSSVSKFVCQGYVLGGYPPAAGAFVVARAVVCHAEVVVLPSPNQGQSGWHRCPSTLEAPGAAMRTRSGAARSGWSPKPAKAEQCSARPYDSNFAAYAVASFDASRYGLSPLYNGRRRRGSGRNCNQTGVDAYSYAVRFGQHVRCQMSRSMMITGASTGC